jgi:hypothetical protein
MSFFIKSVFWLAVVFAILLWRDGPPSRVAESSRDAAPSRAAKARKPASHGGMAQERGKSPAQLAESAGASLLGEGAGALAAAARERCLARPRECLSAAESLRQVLREPSR